MADPILCEHCDHEPFKTKSGLVGHQRTVHGISGGVTRIDDMPDALDVLAEVDAELAEVPEVPAADIVSGYEDSTDTMVQMLTVGIVNSLASSGVKIGDVQAGEIARVAVAENWSEDDLTRHLDLLRHPAMTAASVADFTHPAVAMHPTNTEVSSADYTRIRRLRREKGMSERDAWIAVVGYAKEGPTETKPEDTRPLRLQQVAFRATNNPYLEQIDGLWLVKVAQTAWDAMAWLADFAAGKEVEAPESIIERWEALFK